MTTPTRDEFPPRDPRFDAAWRAASGETPPANLDAAILAAARREVGAGPQSISAQAAMHARRRWWPLAAAATVAAIAVGVVQLATHEELGAPSADNAVVSDMPAQPAKPAANAARPQAEGATAPTSVPPPPMTPAPAPAPAPSPPSPAPAKSVAREQTAASGGNAANDGRASAPAPIVATPMQKKSEATPALAEPFPAAPSKLGASAAADTPPTSPAAQAPSTRAAEMAAPAPLRQPASPGAAAESPSQDVAAQRGEAAGAVSPAVPRPAPPPASAFAGAPRMDVARPAPVAKTSMAEPQKETAARIKDRSPLPIPDWIALIRRLRDEGNTAAAALELAAFRAAHADHEKLLPPDLRDWRPPEK